jgi:hypothetical protein
VFRPLIRAALVALMPPAAGFPGVADTGLDEFLDRFRRESSRMLWIGVVAGAVVFTLLPPFTIGVPLPSFLLGAKLRDRYAAAVTKHPLYLVRQAIFILKMCGGLCWGQHPAVRAQLNLPPYPADPGTWRTS